MSGRRLVVAYDGPLAVDLHTIDGPTHTQLAAAELELAVVGVFEAEAQLEVLGLPPPDPRLVLEVAVEVELEPAHRRASGRFVRGEWQRLAPRVDLLADDLLRARERLRAYPGGAGLDAQPGQRGVQDLVHEPPAHQRLGLGLQARGAEPALHEPPHRAADIDLEAAGREHRLRQPGEDDRRAQRRDRLGRHAGSGRGPRPSRLGGRRRLAQGPGDVSQGAPPRRVRDEIALEERAHVLEEAGGQRGVALLVRGSPRQREALLGAGRAGVEEHTLAGQHVVARRQVQLGAHLVGEEGLGAAAARELPLLQAAQVHATEAPGAHVERAEQGHAPAGRNRQVDLQLGQRVVQLGRRGGRDIRVVRQLAQLLQGVADGGVHTGVGQLLRRQQCCAAPARPRQQGLRAALDHIVGRLRPGPQRPPEVVELVEWPARDIGPPGGRLVCRPHSGAPKLLLQPIDEVEDVDPARCPQVGQQVLGPPVVPRGAQ